MEFTKYKLQVAKCKYDKNNTYKKKTQRACRQINKTQGSASHALCHTKFKPLRLQQYSRDTSFETSYLISQVLSAITRARMRGEPQYILPASKAGKIDRLFRGLNLKALFSPHTGLCYRHRAGSQVLKKAEIVT